MESYKIFHERQMKLTDGELKKMHGDHVAFSIARWRQELEAGATELCYIDWRADRLWCAAQARKR